MTSILAWQKKEYDVECSKLNDVNKLNSSVLCHNDIENLKIKGNHDNFSTEAEVDIISSRNKIEQPKIRRKKLYYCSRTHSQLDQIVNELKNCHESYIHDIKMCVLGSRGHLCVNEDVLERSQKSNINDECMLSINGKGCAPCRYVRGVPRILEDLQKHSVWGVDDLRSMGVRRGGCPYYTSREMLKSAEIVITPYNYIFDAGCRESLGIDLKDAVVVMDEGHNISDASRSAGSLEVNLAWLTLVSKQLSISTRTSVTNQAAYKGIYDLVNGLVMWMTRMSDLLVVSGYQQEDNIWSGYEAIAILEAEVSLTSETIDIYKQFIARICEENKLMERLMDDENNFLDSVLSTASMLGGAQQEEKTGEVKSKYMLNPSSLIRIKNMLYVFDLLLQNNHENAPLYKLVLRKEKARKSSSSSESSQWDMTLHLWCLSGSVVFQQLSKSAHSILVTSGTLSPLESYEQELGVSFPVKYEAPHVIDLSKQLFIRGVATCSDVSLQCTYQNQDNILYLDALGQSISSMCHCTPGGTLVFFPSYSFLHKAVARWDSLGLLSELSNGENGSAIFIEPRNVKDLEGVMAKYYECIDNGSKAVIFSVCRGKISEGINFSNNYARCVIIVGIPFPNTNDEYVKLIRQHQNQMKSQNPSNVDGEQWYVQQAYRAVNQSMGRCIRHRNDYGAIILCDPRYLSSTNQSNLSKWVRASVVNCSRLEDVVEPMRSFFSNIAIDSRLYIPLVKHVPTLPDSHVTTGSVQSAIKRLFGKYVENITTVKNELEALSVNKDIQQYPLSWDIIHDAIKKFEVDSDSFLSPIPQDLKYLCSCPHFSSQSPNSSNFAIAVKPQTFSEKYLNRWCEKHQGVRWFDKWIATDGAVYRFLVYNCGAEQAPSSSSSPEGEDYLIAAQVIAGSKTIFPMLDICFINSIFIECRNAIRNISTPNSKRHKRIESKS